MGRAPGPVNAHGRTGMALQEHVDIGRAAVVDPRHDEEDSRLIRVNGHALAVLHQHCLQALGGRVAREQPRRPDFLGHLDFLALDLGADGLAVAWLLGLGRVLQQLFNALFRHGPRRIHLGNVPAHAVAQQLFPMQQRPQHGIQYRALARPAGGCAQGPQRQRFRVAVAKGCHLEPALQHRRQNSQAGHDRQGGRGLGAGRHGPRHIRQPGRQHVRRYLWRAQRARQDGVRPGGRLDRRHCPCNLPLHFLNARHGGQVVEIGRRVHGATSTNLGTARNPPTACAAARACVTPGLPGV